MHASGMRLPLGRSEETVPVSLPYVGVFDRWQSRLRPGPAAARPVRSESPEQQAAAWGDSRIQGAGGMTSGLPNKPGRLQQLAEWADHRTGLETAVKNFLYENIPASSGWHQVLGSVAVFLFLLQAFTGVLLAFNYAPTPGDAYNSLRYIVTELTGGRLIRGLH